MISPIHQAYLDARGPVAIAAELEEARAVARRGHPASPDCPTCQALLAAGPAGPALPCPTHAWAWALTRPAA